MKTATKCISISLFLLTFFGLRTGWAQPSTVYSHGNPTAEEQYLLELINRARANPTEEGNRLADTKDPRIVKSYSSWGINPEDVRAAFAGYPVRPPLAFNEKLITAARIHSQDMIDHDYQSHTGSDGSSFSDRINAAGYINWAGAGENIYAYSSSLWETHAMFNIDFGNPGLGHRTNIMNFGTTLYREIGIGTLHEFNPSTKVGEIVTTEDFGIITKNWFLCGVVYNDGNQNGMYDAGEGMAGVTIMPESGTYYAVTSASGGYAIPIAGLSGTLRVTASGGLFPAPVTKTISLTGENVKLDFNTALTFPEAVTTLSPAQNSTITTDTVTCNWIRDDAGVVAFDFELATDSLFTDILASDTSVAGTSKLLSSLPNGTRLYWRVRARNGSGWGPWSLVSAFDVAIPASAPVLITPPTWDQVTDAHTFRWKKSAPGVTLYEFEIARDAAFSNVVIADSSLTDTLRSAVLDNGVTYFWHVRAKNVVGWGPFSAASQFKKQILPTKVTLLTPAAGETNPAADVTFTWTRSTPGVTRYALELATDQQMLTYTVNDSTVSDTAFVFNALQHGKTYYWRVTAYNGAGWGYASQQSSFTVRIKPSVVTLVEPANSTTSTTGSRRFKWNAAAPGITAYHFTLYNTTSDRIVIDDTTITDNETYVTLDEGSSYWWQVRAKNSAGWGDLSEKWVLNSKTTAAGDVPAANGFTLHQNTPNPFSSVTTIGFNLESSSPVTLTIVNTLGQKIATLVDGWMSAGEHQIRWTPASYLHGSFFYRLQAGGRIEIRKMMLK
jgi:hypothetical protein